MARNSNKKRASTSSTASASSRKKQKQEQETRANPMNPPTEDPETRVDFYGPTVAVPSDKEATQWLVEDTTLRLAVCYRCPCGEFKSLHSLAQCRVAIMDLRVQQASTLMVDELADFFKVRLQDFPRAEWPEMRTLPIMDPLLLKEYTTLLTKELGTLPLYSNSRGVGIIADLLRDQEKRWLAGEPTHEDWILAKNAKRHDPAWRKWKLTFFGKHRPKVQEQVPTRTVLGWVPASMYMIEVGRARFHRRRPGIHFDFFRGGCVDLVRDTNVMKKATRAEAEAAGMPIVPQPHAKPDDAVYPVFGREVVKYVLRLDQEQQAVRDKGQKGVKWEPYIPGVENADRKAFLEPLLTEIKVQEEACNVQVTAAYTESGSDDDPEEEEGDGSSDDDGDEAGPSTTEKKKASVVPPRAASGCLTGKSPEDTGEGKPPARTQPTPDRVAGATGTAKAPARTQPVPNSGTASVGTPKAPVPRNLKTAPPSPAKAPALRQVVPPAPAAAASEATAPPVPPTTPAGGNPVSLSCEQDIYLYFHEKEKELAELGLPTSEWISCKKALNKEQEAALAALAAKKGPSAASQNPK